MTRPVLYENGSGPSLRLPPVYVCMHACTRDRPRGQPLCCNPVKGNQRETWPAVGRGSLGAPPPRGGDSISTYTSSASSTPPPPPHGGNIFDNGIRLHVGIRNK